MKKIFYEKVGRRYVPVQEYDDRLLDAYPKGAHLVMSYPGGQSRVYNVEPNYAALIAASRVALDSMTKAIADASQMHRDQHENTCLTNEQHAAWEHFVKVMGERGRYVHYKSTHDIAQAGIQALQAEADRIMQNPAASEAYEHFLFITKLVK